MEDGPVLISIQKELLQLLLKDEILKKRFLNVSPKKNKGDPENLFVGFIILKKIDTQGDIGFSLKRFENWAHENECCMKIEDNFVPQYISSFVYNPEKDIVTVSLLKNNILETLHDPGWKKNCDETNNAVRRKKSAFVCYVDGQIDSVANTRTLLYAFFLKRFFCYFEKSVVDVLCEVRNAIDNEKSYIILAQKDISCIENELTLEKMKPDAAQHHDLLQYQSRLKKRFPQCLLEKDAHMEMDGKKFVEQNISNRDAYLNDIEHIKLFDEGKPAASMQDAVSIISLLGEETVNIIHVVLSQRLHHVQKSALLLHALSDIKSQKFCVLKDQGTSMMNSYLDSRRKELFASYTSRYGRRVTGVQWDETIKQVAVSSIILDIFSSSVNKQFDSQKSLFILYNYARLCKLLEHFEDKVNQGIYEPLPDIKNVCFSLLSEESEWNLILQYVLKYPDLLNYLYHCLYKDSNHIHLPVHQLSKFLFDLCHDFSSYYHHTKILLDPQPHLSQLISARLYLILTLKEIMNHAFMLLGIVPPEQM